MINFGGRVLPSYVKVTNITHSILPTIQHKFATVLGRAGAYDFGVDLGMRKLSVDIIVIGDNQNDIMNKATKLAEWLFYEDLQPLIVLDEPTKQYMARISGDTELSELYRIGQGTLDFICPNGYKESVTVTEVLASPLTLDDIIQVDNYGSAKVYPKVELTLKQDTSAIALISDKDFIMLGESRADKAVIDNTPMVLSDPLDTYTGWTTGFAPDGGTNVGTFVSNGFSISVTGKDYGTGTGWHGATAIKSLSRTLQDFEVQAAIGHVSNKVSQMGRIEVYLYDINNISLGKMALTDNSALGDHARVEARAGGLNTGKYFVNSYGNKRGVWANSNPAVIRISRVGSTWNFYIGKVAADGSHHTRLNQQWIDVKNSYGGKVAKIMIHIGTYGTNAPVNTMYFSDLKVRDKGITVDNDTEVGMPFKQGDVITIDNNKAEILLNGEPCYSLLNPSSSFFPLLKGTNGLILSPPIADVKVEYRERWL